MPLGGQDEVATSGGAARPRDPLRGCARQCTPRTVRVWELLRAAGGRASLGARAHRAHRAAAQAARAASSAAARVAPDGARQTYRGMDGRIAIRLPLLRTQVTLGVPVEPRAGPAFSTALRRR